MHLTIIAGGSFAGASPWLLLLFLGLKTLADVIMHKVEHVAWGRKTEAEFVSDWRNSWIRELIDTGQRRVHRYARFEFTRTRFKILALHSAETNTSSALCFAGKYMTTRDTDNLLSQPSIPRIRRMVPCSDLKYMHRPGGVAATAVSRIR